MWPLYAVVPAAAAAVAPAAAAAAAAVGVEADEELEDRDSRPGLLGTCRFQQC